LRAGCQVGAADLLAVMDLDTAPLLSWGSRILAGSPSLAIGAARFEAKAPWIEIL
jgi:hypothetical protein